MDTYSPKDVKILWGGVPITGLLGNITITNDSNLYNKVVGIQGDVARARVCNKTKTVKIPLQQTSLSNAVFDATRLLDDASNSGVVPLQIIDTRNGESLIAAEAWIEKAPDKVYSDTIEGREWTIATGNTVDIDSPVAGS